MSGIKIWDATPIQDTDIEETIKIPVQKSQTSLVPNSVTIKQIRKGALDAQTQVIKEVNKVNI